MPGPGTPFTTRLIDGVSNTTLVTREDDRGHLTELFRSDEVLFSSGMHGQAPPKPAMAYVSTTKAGVVRGPHEHVNQTDVFVFLRSRFDLYLWDNRPKSRTYWHRLIVAAWPEECVRVVIPPGVVHAYQALSNDGTVLNFPDKLFAGWLGNRPVDEIRHENDAATDFRLW